MQYPVKFVKSPYTPVAVAYEYMCQGQSVELVSLYSAQLKYVQIAAFILTSH